MELISSLELAEVFVYADNSNASLIDIVSHFEWLCNKNFNRCYEVRRRISMRKKNRTPFLDKLIALQTKKD